MALRDYFKRRHGGGKVSTSEVPPKAPDPEAPSLTAARELAAKEIHEKLIEHSKPRVMASREATGWISVFVGKEYAVAGGRVARVVNVVPHAVVDMSMSWTFIIALMSEKGPSTERIEIERRPYKVRLTDLEVMAKHTTEMVRVLKINDDLTKTIRAEWGSPAEPPVITKEGDTVPVVASDKIEWLEMTVPIEPQPPVTTRKRQPKFTWEEGAAPKRPPEPKKFTGADVRMRMDGKDLSPFFGLDFSHDEKESEFSKMMDLAKSGVITEETLREAMEDMYKHSLEPRTLPDFLTRGLDRHMSGFKVGETITIGGSTTFAGRTSLPPGRIVFGPGSFEFGRTDVPLIEDMLPITDTPPDVKPVYTYREEPPGFERASGGDLDRLAKDVARISRRAGETDAAFRRRLAARPKR